MASTFPTTNTLLSSTHHLTSHPPSTIVTITTATPHSSFPVHRPTSSQFTFHLKHHNNNNNNRAGIRSWRNNVSFFPNFLTKPKDIDILKEELFEAIASLDRGVEATPEDQEAVDKIASELEKVNRIKEPVKSDLLNGKWELLYTTSQSILGTQRPKFLRPNGKIYQAINVDTLRAQNIETWPFFNQALANLVPLNTKRLAVKFDCFKIAGLITIKSSGSGRGQLEITYLDEELRISRGNRGNLFILKMADPSYRVPL